MPMMKPAASNTYGMLSAPRSAMNFDRVIGLMTLYDIIARNEYANIIRAVVLSRSRTSATGDSSRWMNGMESLYGRADVRVENRPLRRLDGFGGQPMTWRT